MCPFEPGQHWLPDLFSFAEVSELAMVYHLSALSNFVSNIHGDHLQIFQPLGSLQELEPQKYTTFSCHPSPHEKI